MLFYEQKFMVYTQIEEEQLKKYHPKMYNCGRNTYDIFLSHNINDKKVVKGLWIYLAKLGYTVYIDWIFDYEVNRANINRNTADMLKSRMKICHSMFYLVTPNSKQSIWTPWECGFFERQNGKIAICPILERKNIREYEESGFLSLYPYVLFGKLKDEEEETLLVNDHSKIHTFKDWVKR